VIDESAEPPEAEEPAADTPQDEASTPAPDEEPSAAAPAEPDEDLDDDEELAPRVKPAIPGADLEVDIVAEGADPLAREEMDEYELAEALAAEEDRQDENGYWLR
jgi:small subunit ribosomal protein S9